MVTFLAKFAVFVLEVFGMSLGWIIKRKCIQGTQRYRSTCCKRVFQLSCRYKAKLASIKDRIMGMAINGADVQDTAKTLRVGVSPKDA